MRWKKQEPRPETYWKPWFAWYPVKIEDTGETVWLEHVWRHDEVYGSIGGNFVESRFRTDVHWGVANIERRGEGWPNFLIKGE